VVARRGCRNVENAIGVEGLFVTHFNEIFIPAVERLHTTWQREPGLSFVFEAWLAESERDNRIRLGIHDLICFRTRTKGWNTASDWGVEVTWPQACRDSPSDEIEVRSELEWGSGRWSLSRFESWRCFFSGPGLRTSDFGPCVKRFRSSHSPLGVLF